MVKKVFTLFIISLIFSSLIGQEKFSDPKVAQEYYINKEYDKAIIIYKNLYDNSNNPTNYFTYYLNCLIQLQEYENAERLIKKENKRRPDELSLIVELGSVYKLQGLEEKSIKEFDLALKKLNSDRNQIIRLSNTYRGKREYGYAEKSIIKGRELLGNNNLFRMDMAGIYLMERKYEEMVNEYLLILSEDNSNLANVQSRLQSAMYIDVNDEVYNIIKNAVLLKLQQNPNITPYGELLIWLYIQKKDFDKAFYQAKALDSRLGEDGTRIMNIVNLTYSNEFYTTCLEVLDYVISKGKDSRYYFSARKYQLDVKYKLIKNSPDSGVDSYTNIEKMYLDFLNEFGNNASTAEANKDLAHIEAFYLNKSNIAIDRLLELLGKSGIKKKITDDIKLELADIYLFVDNIWEAALLYAQIEKDNEENPVGHEAKLRKAKLAYFSGDFLWAQAQLNVLKASTSKLIANDAFELSMLINENTALDTSTTAMKMFARADFLIYRDKTTEALEILDSILVDFPRHSLTDNIIYKKGEIMLRRKDFLKASEYFKTVADNYGYDILGDNALFQLANINENFLNNKETAQTLYERLLTDYPGSIFTVESRKRFRLLRGDKPDTEVIPEKEITP